MTSLDCLRHNLAASIRAKQAALADAALQAAFAAAVDALLSCFRAGHRLYIAGNGGSAADAQHLAAEFVCKLAQDRAALAAEALTVDTSLLTSLSNDYGFAIVFSRQLEAKLRPGDVFLALSTSGISPNILKALETCRAKGNTSLLLTGRDGGPARELADICLIAPGESTSTIQEVHAVLYHSLCESVEAILFQA